MTKPRASVFEEVTEVDLSAFTPKTRPETKAPTQEQVRAVAEAANFRSREASPAASKPPKKRTARVHRTGRNVQLNIKASQDTIDLMYAITEANKGWVLGYTLERAMAALKRELEAEGTS